MAWSIARIGDGQYKLLDFLILIGYNIFMLGSIIGDIAGSVFEFNNIKVKGFSFFDENKDYTDDSVLTVATADWLLNGGMPGDYYYRYARMYPNPMGAYGSGFLNWVHMSQEGALAQPYNSCGNGSAMRVGPVGWAFDTLNETLDAVDLDTVRCLVLTGAGDKSFVAGADIAEMSSLTKAEGEAFGKKGNDVFRKLETFPIPVIAAVNGFALGGGCEISMSCDIRICSDNAVFGQPEVGLGITPGFGGTQRLARLVSPGMAKQLIYTARNIKAAEALRIGLVNQVVSAEVDEAGNVTKTAQEAVVAAAKKMAAGIAMQAPIAVRNCKKAINEGLNVDMDQAIVIEEKLFGDCFETEDQQAGMGNFLKPKEEKLKVVPFKNK